MKKLRLERTNNVTFREGCERYPDVCIVRNLREETVLMICNCPIVIIYFVI
jgi:hypothetical protein